MSDSKIYKILLIGPQGSGKGTQAQILAEKFNIPYFAMGNILRQRAQAKDELGIKIANLINNGIFAPDKLVHQIMAEKMKQFGDQGYVLDGYPRSLSQAKFFDKEQKLTHVLEIYISDQESSHRFLGRRTCEQCQTVYHLEYNPPSRPGVCDKCGGKLIVRADETEEALKTRLTTYHEVTEPMIEFYKQKQIWQRINGEQPIPEVAEEIISKLHP